MTAMEKRSWVHPQRLHDAFRRLRRRFSADRVFVMACSFAIAVGLTAIAALTLAAFAFTQVVTIQFPLVVTFRGFSSEGEAHAVTAESHLLGATAVRARRIGLRRGRRALQSPGPTRRRRSGPGTSVTSQTSVASSSESSASICGM